MYEENFNFRQTLKLSNIMQSNLYEAAWKRKGYFLATIDNRLISAKNN